MIRKLLLLAGSALVFKMVKDRASASPAAQSSTGAGGHVPVDLMRDTHPDGSERADEHFRPDPTGTVDAEDRESFRPVTAPAPHDPPGR